MFKIVVNLFSLAAILMLFSNCTTSKEDQMAAAAKDWCSLIRGSQVIPIYPLDEDLQPGDIFLVNVPISRQQEIYVNDGDFPLTDDLDRLQPKGYSNFYSKSFLAAATNFVLPGDWIRPQGTISNSWLAAPHAAFPTYSFSIRRGKGNNMGIRLEGVPIGLSLLGSDAVDGTVTLKRASTLGVDTLSLYAQLQGWASTNREFISNYGCSPSDKTTNFLRVITRVYAIGYVDISMRDASARSAGSDVGFAKPVIFSNPQTVTNVTSVQTNWAESTRLLQSRIAEGSYEKILPGGSLRLTAASTKAISLSETFNPPVIIGYLGFDCQILKGGILGPPISTKAVLDSEAIIPSSQPAEYSVEACSYEVDFNKWEPVNSSTTNAHSPVSIVRSELIRKETKENVDYIIPFYTTGVRIDYHALKYPKNATPIFTEIPNAEEPNNKYYQYSLPIGREAMNHKENLSTQFTFWNGFRNPTNEWWAAAVKYPTKQLSVVMHFSKNKPCKDIVALRRDGFSAQEIELIQNKPNISDEGQTVTWRGKNISGNSRIYFRFNW